MQAYLHQEHCQLIVDGMALDPEQPFQIFETLPHSDSSKSLASTKVGANEDIQEMEMDNHLDQVLSAFNHNNYQELYRLMLKFREM
jgi:hypothetical protein